MSFHTAPSRPTDYAYQIPPAGLARRNLFGSDDHGSGVAKLAAGNSQAPVGGLTTLSEAVSLVTMPALATVVATASQASNQATETTATVDDLRGTECAGVVSPESRATRRYAHSFALFLRKVYHLASLRLKDLCCRLQISNELRHM